MEVKAAPADLCPETLYLEKAEVYQMVGALASNRQSPEVNYSLKETDLNPESSQLSHSAAGGINPLIPLQSPRSVL